MLYQLAILSKNFLRVILRDRVLHGVMAVALVMILLIPALSSFSMRQVQELAITLSLTSVSLVLLVATVLLGASSIWRDIERRYTTSILTFPLKRATYFVGKYCSIGFFLLMSTVVLGIGCVTVVMLASLNYPADQPVQWMNLILALYGGLLKYLLLAAVALLLSSVSTSFYLPFFGSVVIYLCGNASQKVYEYVNGPFGDNFSVAAKIGVTAVYYILPNLSAFDFQVHAVYGLPVELADWLWITGYAFVYIGILVGMGIYAFDRRQLP